MNQWRNGACMHHPATRHAVLMVAAEPKISVDEIENVCGACARVAGSEPASSSWLGWRERHFCCFHFPVCNATCLALLEDSNGR